MNKKVSELASALVASAGDLLLVAQAGISKKLAIENLFGSIQTPVGINSTLNFGGIPPVVTSGAIPLTAPVVHINLSSTQTLTLGAGKQGQVLFLVSVSGTGTSTINANLWATPIVFNTVGFCALLQYTGGRWANMSGTAH